MYRTIKEENIVETRVNSAKTKYSRFEDAFDALKWILARKPENGIKIDNKFLYKQNGQIDSSVPEITVLYTYNENEVNILEIKFD